MTRSCRVVVVVDPISSQFILISLGRKHLRLEVAGAITSSCHRETTVRLPPWQKYIAVSLIGFSVLYPDEIATGAIVVVGSRSVQ